MSENVTQEAPADRSPDRTCAEFWSLPHECASDPIVVLMPVLNIVNLAVAAWLISIFLTFEKRSMPKGKSRMTGKEKQKLKSSLKYCTLRNLMAAAICECIHNIMMSAFNFGIVRIRYVLLVQIVFGGVSKMLQIYVVANICLYWEELSSQSLKRSDNVRGTKLLMFARRLGISYCAVSVLALLGTYPRESPVISRNGVNILGLLLQFFILHCAMCWITWISFKYGRLFAKTLQSLDSGRITLKKLGPKIISVLYFNVGYGVCMFCHLFIQITLAVTGVPKTQAYRVVVCGTLLFNVVMALFHVKIGTLLSFEADSSGPSESDTEANEATVNSAASSVGAEELAISQTPTSD